MVNFSLPPGAQVFIDGSNYKIGLDGNPYRHNGCEWVRSSKNKNVVMNKIKLQENENNGR